MSEKQKPLILTLLCALAIVTGIFSVIRGGLMILGGINQLMAGVGGVFELIFGVLSLAVGALALISSINVLRERTGWIEWMKKYAIGLALYNAAWVIFSIVFSGKIGWLSVAMELAIAGVTLSMLKTSEDIKKYLASED